MEALLHRPALGVEKRVPEVDPLVHAVSDAEVEELSEAEGDELSELRKLGEASRRRRGG